MREKSIVRATGLTKVYGSGHTAVRAVDNVSLDVREGELVLIMGPSGSGKTTLLSMLGGLLRPTSGHIFINGVEITTLSEARLPDIRAREIGFIFQAFNLLSSLTAEENILFPAGLVPGGDRRARQRASELLDRLALSPRRRHLPRDLSGGEKQRVAIARALINSPRLILADEPTGNLDSKTGHEVMMILHDIARDEGRTVIIVTHDPRLEDVADRILWLEDGKIRDRKEDAHLWAQDPVCRMKVDQWTASLFATYQGVRYFFCSQRCLDKFRREPQAYLVATAKPQGSEHTSGHS
ncbi:MAG: ATP-binding cassette domain-containing protein [Chloroflexi bacterium]|nr:ATP-binding cassette domain-containing protein [Chloroflexota bacterium]